MMNLFQPSVKLIRKTRTGSRLRRTYGSRKLLSIDSSQALQAREDS